MHKTLVLVVLAFVLGACSDPRTTKIPADLSQLGTIQPALDKLDSADRRRVAAYEMRARMGGLFGGSAPAASVTIGEAIDKEKGLEAAEAAKEAEEKQVAAAVAAKRAEQMKILDAAVTAGLVSKGTQTEGFLDYVTVHVAFRNKSPKEIAGVKGNAIFRDMFGDTLKSATVSYDQNMKPGETKTWGGQMSVLGSLSGDMAKLQSTPVEKIKFTFEPTMVVFADGTKIEAPDLPN